MKASLDLNAQRQAVRQPPPPTWGVAPQLPPAQGTSQRAREGAGGVGGGASGEGQGVSGPQKRLDEFMEHLERLNSLRELMAETIRLYYVLNGLSDGKGQGIHELLFPQYWARGDQDRVDPLARSWNAGGLSAAIVAGGAAIQLDVRACPGHRPVEAPPMVGVAEGLRAPISPLPLSEEQLDRLPPPPLPERLRTMLESALATPWNAGESASFYHQADRNLTPEQIRHALDDLPELEQALGMALGKTPGGHYGTGVNLSGPNGFENLAAERLASGSTATGAYLYRLVKVYQDYKAEYYGLTRAIDRDLYHRDPCSIHPRVGREDAMSYLEAKYAPAMEGLIWRVTRTSSPIMLDLDGDGELAVTGTSTARDRAAGNGFVAQGSVQFDLDGDGRKEQTEWMAGDGMLVDDRDGGASRAAAGDGEIDGKRLFGDEGGRYANGYQKLQGHDVDGDGKLTGSELEGLKVWVDDGDARVEAGELSSMAELGITEMSTQMARQTNSDGESLMRSTFVQDGETRTTEDVWFAQR